MPPLTELGHRPAHVTADEHFAPWFAEIAARYADKVRMVATSLSPIRRL